MIYGILGLLMIVAPIIFIIYAVKSYKLHKEGDKIRGAEGVALIASGIFTLILCIALFSKPDNNSTDSDNNSTIITEELKTTDKENTENKEAQRDDEENEPFKNDNILFIQGDEYSIKIIDVKSNGKSITLHYDYTNESEEEQTPIYKLSIHFFQNGIELDSDYSRDNYKDQDTILGGYTNTGLEKKVKLNDDSDIVLIKVKPWVDFSHTVYAEYEFNINTNELTRIK